VGDVITPFDEHHAMRRVRNLTYPVARKARERAPKLFARICTDRKIEILVQHDMHSALRPATAPPGAAPGKAALVLT
jgi:hypothetical protein